MSEYNDSKLSPCLPVLCRSLGLVLVECLTGRYPFDASGGPMELIIHVSITARPDHPLPGAYLFASCLDVLSAVAA